jgi:hypothetical protein
MYITDVSDEISVSVFWVRVKLLLMSRGISDDSRMTLLSYGANLLLCVFLHVE